MKAVSVTPTMPRIKTGKVFHLNLEAVCKTIIQTVEDEGFKEKDIITITMIQRPGLSMPAFLAWVRTEELEMIELAPAKIEEVRYSPEKIVSLHDQIVGMKVTKLYYEKEGNYFVMQFGGGFEVSFRIITDLI